MFASHNKIHRLLLSRLRSRGKRQPRSSSVPSNVTNTMAGSTGMYNKQHWGEFLDIYRKNSCLWDIQSDTYMRRDLRNASYNLLLEKFREVEPNATLEMVKRKIDIFRTGYRREVRKINEAKVNSQEYKPTLWYYDKMNFLDYIIVNGDSADMKDLHDSDDQQDIEYIDIPDESPEPDPVVKYRMKMRKLDATPRPRHRLFARKTQDSPSPRKTPDSPPPPPQCDSKSASFSNESEEDCATFCASLKLQMRGLATQQKFIAQKLISDVIFMARTSQLTLNSSIVNISDDFDQ